MKCYGLWWGGGSYARPELTDVEEFDSLRSAVACFQARAENADGRTPCVDASTMLLYRSKEDVGEENWWRFLEMGPRGGVKVNA